MKKHILRHFLRRLYGLRKKALAIDHAAYVGLQAFVIGRATAVQVAGDGVQILTLQVGEGVVLRVAGPIHKQRGACLRSFAQMLQLRVIQLEATAKNQHQVIVLDLLQALQWQHADAMKSIRAGLDQACCLELRVVHQRDACGCQPCAPAYPQPHSTCQQQ